MGDETGGDRLMDVLGDADARSVLASVSEAPRSAKELGEEHGLSLPTVYRRLDRLADHGLVASRTAVEDDGTHYRRYEATFERMEVSLESGAYRVRVDYGDGLSPVDASGGGIE